MDSDVGTDVSLASRVVAGDEDALEALYARHSDPLFAFICHQVAVREDAEDVWQETWQAALRGLPAYGGRSRFFTWLCGIARHKIADHFRRRGQRGVPVLSELPPDELASLMDSGPLPEAIVLSGATSALVIEALAVLPKDYRTALLARYAEKRSVEAVASMMGKSYKATESLLVRAHGALRDALAQLSEDN